MNQPNLRPARPPGTLLSTATVNGRSHRIWRQNSHDTALGGGYRQRGSWWGLVLDGCGGKTVAAGRRIPSHNEVGAKLSGQFIDGWWREQLGRKEHIPLASLLDTLYEDYQLFLERLLALFPWAGVGARAIFCSSHLLATLVGFVVTPSEAAFYWRGDGFLCTNGTVMPLESDNRPDYPAYDFLAGERKGGEFQTRFLDRQALSWLAVASDGWQPALLAELAEPRPSLALERWLYLRARERANFEDDGAVAVLYLGDQDPGPPLVTL